MRKPSSRGWERGETIMYDSKTLSPWVEKMWKSNDSSLSGQLQELAELWTYMLNASRDLRGHQKLLPCQK